MIDPKMMAQLGVAGNIMNMMTEMASNPDMAEIIGAMGGNIEGIAKKKVIKEKNDRMQWSF